MKKIFCFVPLLVLLVIAGCGNKGKQEKTPETMPSAVDLKGDSTRYGLACEGCTDSVIYFLPSDNSDPVKYNIFDAFLKHHVYGRPRIGDNIAVVVNPTDSTVADFVIDLDNLMSTWCYIVMPEMRDFDKMPKKLQKRIMHDMPDSIKQSYIVPREYGFTLKTNNNAMPVGFVKQSSALEDESPVVYPVLPFYRQWHLLNGKLILSRALGPMTSDKNAAKGKTEGAVRFENDTTEIVFMNEDSLVLKFKDHQQSYYRLGDAADANKLARQKAEKLTRQAQSAIKNN